MRKEIFDKKNLLRRIGYHSAALSRGVAMTVADAMKDSSPTHHSGNWQIGKETGKIQTELNTIHRTILGVEAGTCVSGVRHELGVKTQLLRANIATHKFPKIAFYQPPRTAWHIHTVRMRPFWEIRKRDHAYKNSAIWYMKASATAVPRLDRSTSEMSSKMAVKKYALLRQNEYF